MVTFFSAFCSSQVLSNNLACTLWSICQTCSSSLSSLSSISSLNRSRFPPLQFLELLVSAQVPSEDAPQGSVLVALTIAAPILSDGDSITPPAPCLAMILVVNFLLKLSFHLFPMTHLPLQHHFALERTRNFSYDTKPASCKSVARSISNRTLSFVSNDGVSLLLFGKPFASLASSNNEQLLKKPVNQKS
jgi:hypothetical protein